MTENPSTSQRTTARRIGLLQMTIQRMLSVLNLRPYKIQFTHPLNEDYKQKRLIFVKNMKQLINGDGISVKQIFFSDNGPINKQNYRFWKFSHYWNQGIETSKSHRLVCSLSATQIFGPVFIEENITGDVYQTLLKSEFLPWCEKKIIFRTIFGLCKMGLLLIAQNQYFLC